MPLLAFDTHKFITRLTEAGMAPEQAEVLADTYATILTEQVATKADIRQLDARIDALEEKMDIKFAAIDTKFTAMDTKFTAMEDRFQATILRVSAGPQRLLLRCWS